MTCDVIATGSKGNAVLLNGAYLIDCGVPFVVVATKADKLSKSELRRQLESFEENYFKGTGIEVLPFSSVTRDGKDELWSKIFDSIK